VDDGHEVTALIHVEIAVHDPHTEVESKPVWVFQMLLETPPSAPEKHAKTAA
jgi:hypothetical protein